MHSSTLQYTQFEIRGQRPDDKFKTPRGSAIILILTSKPN